MDWYRGAAIAMGLVFLAALFFGASRTKKKVTVGDGLKVFLSGAGAVIGVKAFETAVRSPCLPSDQVVPVMVGGLAVIWIAMESLAGYFRD
jgi:hypothetical protein